MIALVFTGFSWHPAQSASSTPTSESNLNAAYTRARDLYAKGKYIQASQLAAANAEAAERQDLPYLAAVSWSLAGSCAQVDLHPKQALECYLKSKRLAEKANSEVVVLGSCGNIAGVYLQLSDPASAAHYSQLGLNRPLAPNQNDSRAKLQLQLAQSYSQQRRFPEAAPIYRLALETLEDRDDFRTAMIGWHLFGSDAFEAGRFDIAETALQRALYLANMHSLKDTSSILRKLARLKVEQGDLRSAALLYNAAVTAPPGTAPLWLAYADRGEFRLSQRQYADAFQDFAEARSLVKLFRANVVPNEQGRVSQENGLARIASGFIEAGNRLATGNGRQQRSIETFDASQEDHSSTLAALTPVQDDWRSRLPRQYWELLTEYRSLERLAYATGPHSPERGRADALRIEISQMEATAGSSAPEATVSALRHAQEVLGADDLFLSFHTGAKESWLWVLDGSKVDVIALPAKRDLESAIQAFRESVHKSSGFEEQGRALYATLFGKLSPHARTSRRWLMDLDGPLFDLPMAALVLPESKPGSPKYLCEKVALQIAPNALLLRKGRSLSHGTFLGIADPIYNAADARYKGSSLPPLTLPRLPSSRTEVMACARLWGSDRSTVITGPEVNLKAFAAGLNSHPAILHFATHVISGSGEYRSGLIALGLNSHGQMDLLGPMEIVARRVDTELVVMNGCQSGQAQAVPGSGLMGLTRAWIGAGANAVMATRWDVPDDQGESLITRFYQEIGQHPDENIAFALQRAQLSLLSTDDMRRKPAIWAAYFLLART